MNASYNDLHNAALQQKEAMNQAPKDFMLNPGRIRELDEYAKRVSGIASGLGPAQPKVNPNTAQALLTEQQELIDRLKNEVAMLASALDPALRPSSPERTAAGNASTFSQLASYIAADNAQILEVCERLADLRARLDL